MGEGELVVLHGAFEAAHGGGGGALAGEVVGDPCVGVGVEGEGGEDGVGGVGVGEVVFVGVEVGAAGEDWL